MTATYKTGTAAVSNGSVNVVGTGTAWAVALVVGGMFSCNGLSVPIASVVDDTHLTLDYAWPGATGSGQSYSILRENSDAANMVDLTDKLSQLLVDLSLAGIHPDNSGSLAKRDALTLDASNDGYLYLQAELGVAFAFYRWDGPSLAWVGPFPVASATTAAAGVQSIVQGSGVTVDNTNPNIPVIKLANMATSRVRGRASAGAGAPEELTLSQVLDMIGNAAQGDILYRSATLWQRLAKGTALQSLRMNSAANAPEWGSVREVLTANRNYYVRSDGSDSNNGLVNNSGGAFLTLQKAIDTVAALDISIYNVSIQASGVFTSGLVVNGAWVGSGTVELIGDTTTPANATISRTGGNCVLVTNYGRLSIRGFKLTTATSGIGLAAQNGGTVTVTGVMEYGACATAQIYAERLGVITIASNYTISGSSPVHAQALSFGYIFDVTNTITLSGTPAFSSAFARSDRSALIEFSGNTFVGSATGVRYVSSTDGGVNTFGGGASYLPGNTAGATTAPGWYA